MTIDEAIDFCKEKSKNIKLKTEPQTFVMIADMLEELKLYKNLNLEIPQHFTKEQSAWIKKYCIEKNKEFYKQGVDDFTKILTSDELQKYDIDAVFETSSFGTYSECTDMFVEYVNKIAEQLKVGASLTEYKANNTCEWIKYDYRTMCPKNHGDIDNPYWRIPTDMKYLSYCPYCGTRIRLVE